MSSSGSAFQRKHYEAIACALVEAYNDTEQIVANDPSLLPTLELIEQGIMSVRLKLESMFHYDNLQFDQERFDLFIANHRQPVSPAVVAQRKQIEALRTEIHNGLRRHATLSRPWPERSEGLGRVDPSCRRSH